eukprot:Hpha_TRINITY_DN11690_c0_g1::TRINITY_DN11690_c0_g1_i3::g.48961::m.48961
MDEIREAGGLLTTPRLRFQGEILTASVPLADTGVTAEATVEVEAMVVRRIIAAGAMHTMMVRENGAKVVWWGNADDSRGPTIPNFDGMKVIQIAAGAHHSIALMEDHTVRAWGDNHLGQCDAPNFGGVGVVAAGPVHSLARMDDHTIRCWGNNDDGQCSVPDVGGIRVVQIAAGVMHSMALMEDHTLRAWGNNDDQQCTIPDFGGLKVAQIAAGWSHSLALMEDDTLRAWGNNNVGQCNVLGPPSGVLECVV